MNGDINPTKAELKEETRLRECREIILESLEKVKYQSLRHLVENTGLSADDVVYHVDGDDDDIRFEMAGVTPVYFLKKNEPKGKLYNSGYNSFWVKKDEKYMEKQITVKDKMKPEIIEELAAQGLTHQQAADKLGIKKTTFGFYLSDDPKIKQAWQNGKNRGAFNSAFTPAKEIENKIEFDKAALGDFVGNTASQNLNEIQPEEIETAVENGIEKALEIQVDPRISHTLDHISQNGHSKEGIEQKKKDFYESLPSFSIPETYPPQFYLDKNDILDPSHYISVALSNGRTLQIGTDINVFEATKDEFDLIKNIRELVKDFQGTENA